MDAAFASKFASDWIEAWNSADLPRVLSHYTDDFEMSSPNIRTVFGEPSGRLTGKKNVRAYWQMMLTRFWPPKFELLDVLIAPDSLAVEYRNRGRKGIEVFFFNDAGLVAKAVAHYPA